MAAVLGESQGREIMSGQLSHELEVNVPASKAWELYGSLQLAELVVEKLPQLIQKIELVEGDGREGTVLKLILPPETGLTYYNEKFTKIDNDKLIKEAEVVEGGYLELGFTLYRVRMEIIEKGNSSCIIKTTIEYEVKEEAAANASFVSIEPLAAIAEVAKNYLIIDEA